MQEKPSAITMEDIKEIALANGFKLKEQPNGSVDLNPYVYDFAKALLIKVKSNNGVYKTIPLHEVGCNRIPRLAVVNGENVRFINNPRLSFTLEDFSSVNLFLGRLT